MKKFWKFEIVSFVCFLIHCAAAIMDNNRITSFIMIWTPVAAVVVCTVIAMWSLDKTGFEKVFLIIAQLFGYLVLEVIFLIILFFAEGGITL